MPSVSFCFFSPSLHSTPAPTAEEAVGGLIILEATYGQLVSSGAVEDNEPAVASLFFFVFCTSPLFLLFLLVILVWLIQCLYMHLDIHLVGRVSRST